MGISLHNGSKGMSVQVRSREKTPENSKQNQNRWQHNYEKNILRLFLRYIHLISVKSSQFSTKSMARNMSSKMVESV